MQEKKAKSKTISTTNLRLQARKLGIKCYSVLKRGALLRKLRELREIREARIKARESCLPSRNWKIKTENCLGAGEDGNVYEACLNDGDVDLVVSKSKSEVCAVLCMTVLLKRQRRDIINAHKWTVTWK